MLKPCVAFVTYNEYGLYDWTQICVKSFREVFKESYPLICVDHNRNPEEQRFLKDHGVAVVPNPNKDISHGKGLDVAAEYAKEAGHDVMVVVEPDCVFSGDQWMTDLLKAVDEGYSMAGTFRWQYGPIHPCGSAWRLDQIPSSFKSVKKHDDVYHPKYKQLMNLVELNSSVMRTNYNTHLIHFFFHWWDVGIRNWFLLACDGKDKLVSGAGFRHWWGSHKRTPSDLHEKGKMPSPDKWLSPVTKMMI